MLSVTYKPFMLSVVMPNFPKMSVIYAEFTYKPFMLSIVMLSVIMLSVVAPSLYVIKQYCSGKNRGQAVIYSSFVLQHWRRKK
jgi:hypothetical protein